MKILYGFADKVIDITDICFSKLRKDNIITIPYNDVIRANIFTDPAVDVLKNIYILNNEDITEYDDTVIIQIDVSNNNIHTMNHNILLNNAFQYTNIIHSKLQINHGNLNDELPEQIMSILYLTGNEKVLEIGGNIGRNSLTIAHILKQQK